jgi:histidinol phosphatase-like PHP family hydrolase
VRPDLHNHYLRAGDIHAMTRAATEAGVDELGFAEHVFHILEARAASRWLRERFEPEGPPLSHAAYVADVRAAAAAAPIPVRLGIELDARPDDPALEQALADFRAAHGAAWDVVIGSVHVLDGDQEIHTLDDPRPPLAIWRDYVERLRAAVASGLYDVVSHPVRLGFELRETPSEVGGLLRDLARDAARHDTPLELNGTDLRSRPDLVTLLVAACAAERAPVALGSDAHTPRRAGCVLAGIPLLREHGIASVAAFVGRERVDRPLDG